MNDSVFEFVFKTPNKYNPELYIISDTNRQLYQEVLGNKSLSITSPSGLGKTYLTKIAYKYKPNSIWLNKDMLNTSSKENNIYNQIVHYDNIIIDDLDKVLFSHNEKDNKKKNSNNDILTKRQQQKIQEELIFQIINYVISEKKRLVFSTTLDLTKQSFKIQDLKSRLNLYTTHKINLPDIEVIKLYITQILSFNQIQIAKPIFDYIVSNINKNFNYINIFLKKIVSESVIEGQDITINFVKKHL